MAVVTGGAQGIGRGIALVLALRGCTVCILDRDGAALREAVAAIGRAGGRVEGRQVDITQPEEVERTMGAIVEKHGEISLLVNNAGRQECIGASWEAEPSEWWGDVTVNLLGAFLCTRYVLPHMIRAGRGTVVCMAGGGYDGPNPGLGGYGSSKAGLCRFVDNLAVELRTAGHAGLSVLGLWPGFVNTHMIDLLTTVPAGKQWLPHVTEGLAKGEDHPPEVSPAAPLTKPGWHLTVFVPSAGCRAGDRADPRAPSRRSRAAQRARRHVGRRLGGARGRRGGSGGGRRRTDAAAAPAAG